MGNKLPANARSEVLLQKNNDPKHTSRLKIKFLAIEWIKNMNKPAQLPDLDLIEYVWGMVKCQLGKYPRLPSNFHKLGERLKEDW